jgi:dTMP kinase
VLDIPVETAVSRLGQSLDRVESRGPAYFRRVRDGFRAEAERWPSGVELVDGNRPSELVQQDIRELADRYIRRKRTGKT